MAAGLTISYDLEGDILNIDRCPPYLGQDEDEIDDGVVVRANRETGQIENVSILFFNARLRNDGKIHLPIDGALLSTAQ